MYSLMSDPMSKNKSNLKSKMLVPTHADIQTYRPQWSSSFDVYQFLVDSSDHDNSVSYWIYLWFWRRYCNSSINSDSANSIDGLPADHIFARCGAREVAHVFRLVNNTLCSDVVRDFGSHIDSLPLDSLLRAFSISTNKPATDESRAIHADLEAVRRDMIRRCVDVLSVTVTDKPLVRDTPALSEDIQRVSVALQALIALDSDAAGAIE